jgi:transcriptional regulator with XRE-family HTH domain
MPAQAPTTTEAVTALLSDIGERIRTHRKALRVSAAVAAEAAGMSRVTLHRIERGEPSVTMGAYLNAMAALGLVLDVVTPQVREAGANTLPSGVRAAVGLPPRIRLADYPQLKRLAWHIPGEIEVTPEEALGLYERNWRHLDAEQLGGAERELLNQLVATLGKGHLLV